MHNVARSRITSIFLIITLLLISLSLTGCKSQQGASEVSLIVSGSTTVMPIAEQAAEEYMAANKGTSVLVSGMGSSAGIEQVSKGTADVATSSRDLKDEEQGLGLVDTPIAHDGIAAIVNSKNPVKSITTEQLRAIFAGEITNWSEVGGKNIPIDLINRDEASGTREAFAKAIMDETSFDVGAVILPGTGQVREVVSRAEGAIGYISIGFVEPRFVKTSVQALNIDGITATEENVANGTYPISRVLHLFTKGRPKGLAKRYIDYVLSDAVQNGAVVDAGFVPMSATGGK